VTHCFENDVMGTVVQDNVNPIEKVEKSCLMVASTIYGDHNPAGTLLSSALEVERLSRLFPALLENS